MLPRPPKRRFWRKCRIYFRRFRIALWLVALLLLGALLYVNQVGLPGFVKKPLLERLRARGLDLQFSRLRLRWYEGIVAENVRFGRADEPLSPQLTLREVRVPLNFRALSRLRLQVDALVLRQGRLSWPLAETNQSPRDLAVEQIQTDLRFLPDDQWALDNFRAVFAGAEIRLSGIVTNASAVRDWKFLKAQQAAAAPTEIWQNRMRKLADTLEEIRFSAPPILVLEVRGDARDLQSFSVRLHVAAPGAETPWGAITGGHFTGRVFPAGTNEPARAEFTVAAADAQTRWGGITNFVLGVQLRTIQGETNLIQGVLNLSAGQIQTRWAAATNAALSANWIQNLGRPVPLMGDCRLECEDALTEWGRAANVHLAAQWTPPANPQPPWDESWAWWTNLQPYQLAGQARFTRVQSPRLVADEISCGGTWSAPRLLLTNVEARLYGGSLTGRAELDVASRALRAGVATDFDLHRIEPLLGEAGRGWLEQFWWDRPPRANAEVALVLPSWTNRQPDWRAEVQPSISLAGEFNLERGGAFRPRGTAADPAAVLRFTSARSHFLYSNLCWHLPDLTLTRPEGRLVAEHRADERTKAFYWHWSSTLDVRLLRPFLDPDQQSAFDLFTLTQGPVVEAEVWGQFQDSERTGFKGRIDLTNFTFRGVAISRLQTALAYTNRVLQFFGPSLLCGSRRASADGLTADFNAGLVFLTNGFSTVEPMAIARVIGPHIVRAIEPYQFLQPPTAHVYGAIPLHGEEGADLYFDLDGGPFHWWQFTVPHIAGRVHWAGEQVSLTNIQTDFYQGKAAGSAVFDFQPAGGANFRFQMAATNVLFPALIADLAGKTNSLDGRLSGTLAITAANTEDWHSANGHGDMNLRDGLLWDIPIFGIFSPVLNGIVPGLGSSRATAATGSFVLTNGVCRTDNLEIRSSAMRLDYHGTVDLAGQVNAHVEAELLRNMWLVGPLVSTIFWPVTKMFEYKVSGALSDPKMDPVFIIPKLVLFPFHPVRTLKGLLPEDSGAGQTNAPPVFSPPP